MLTEGGPEQAVPLYNLGYKAYFKTPITFQESNAGHTLGQHCACLHDLDASNDELCAHCTVSVRFRCNVRSHSSFVAYTDLLFRSNDSS